VRRLREVDTYIVLCQAHCAENFFRSAFKFVEILQVIQFLLNSVGIREYISEERAFDLVECDVLLGYPVDGPSFESVGRKDVTIL
jgi:hypothetical protein